MLQNVQAERLIPLAYIFNMHTLFIQNLVALTFDRNSCSQLRCRQLDVTWRMVEGDGKRLDLLKHQQLTGSWKEELGLGEAYVP